MKKIILGLISTFFLFPPFSYAKAPDPSTIKSVTYYDISKSPPYSNSDLNLVLPEIQRTGLNTIWLVNPWATLNPQPFNQPPTYNEASFRSLLDTLQTLKTHNMRAIVGLNYLGPGWAPEGINACEWVKEPTNYQAFVHYATEFLTRIQDYSDMTYIMVFTENSVPCSLEPHYEPDKAHQVTQLFQQTLGNFPTQLPNDLRAKFSIGYHDFTLINRNWGNGESPIASPNPFDFVSMLGYALEDTNMESLPESDIQNISNIRAQRFRALYPNLPLVMGKFGASSCNNKDVNQARVISAGVTWAKNNHYGFNVWGWKPGPGAEECTNPVYGGLAITNQDGTPKPAIDKLQKLLTFSGDINLNGRVDIFDYNILISKFGNPYTIFDYNILVANFGKSL